TSVKATVIPPPVKGCRIFNESPMSTVPGFSFGLAGLQWLGITFILPSSTAALYDGLTLSGNWGPITSRKVAVSSGPFRGASPGKSINILVSVLDTGYTKQGDGLATITCPWFL